MVANSECVRKRRPCQGLQQVGKTPTLDRTSVFAEGSAMAAKPTLRLLTKSLGIDVLGTCRPRLLCGRSEL
jgi:hypothetical protein